MRLDGISQRLSSKFIGLFSSKIFHMIVFFKKHLEENHINYNCPQCRQSFSAKAALDDHLRRCPEIFDECRLGILCTEDMVRKNYVKK